MRVHIYLKNTASFTLYNVKRIGMVKHMYEGKYRKIMYFLDEELGLLGYPVADIIEMNMED